MEVARAHMNLVVADGGGGGGGDHALALQARDVERSASGEHAASARGRREGIREPRLGFSEHRSMPDQGEECARTFVARRAWSRVRGFEKMYAECLALRMTKAEEHAGRGGGQIARPAGSGTRRNAGGLRAGSDASRE